MGVWVEPRNTTHRMVSSSLYCRAQPLVARSKVLFNFDFDFDFDFIVEVDVVTAHPDKGDVTKFFTDQSEEWMRIMPR